MNFETSLSAQEMLENKAVEDLEIAEEHLERVLSYIRQIHSPEVKQNILSNLNTILTELGNEVETIAQESSVSLEETKPQRETWKL